MLTSFFILCLCCVLGFLIGSIPPGLVLVWIFKGVDIRIIGSGNIGATNVFRAGYKLLAFLTLSLDVLKPIFAALLINFLTRDQTSPIKYSLIAGFSAVLGHMFSIFLNYKGGKGIASLLGFSLFLDYKMAGVAIVIWIGAFTLTRISSMASIMLLLSLALTSSLLMSGLKEIAMLVLVSTSSFQHRSNIKRLINNEERKISLCN